jgi:hypothetical protein
MFAVTETQEVRMKYIVLDPRTFAFIVGTRAALAVGVGLLVAGRLAAARRRTIGAALVAVGAVTTIPAAISVMRGLRRSSRSRRGNFSADRDTGLIGATRFPRKGDEIV